MALQLHHALVGGLGEERTLESSGVGSRHVTFITDATPASAWPR